MNSDSLTKLAATVIIPNLQRAAVLFRKPLPKTVTRVAPATDPRAGLSLDTMAFAWNANTADEFVNCRPLSDTRTATSPGICAGVMQDTALPLSQLAAVR